MLKLMSKLSVKNKILFPILLVMSVVMVINYFILNNKVGGIIDEVASNEISRFTASLEENIKRVTKKALLTASTIAKFDFVKTAYEFEDEKEGRDYLREKIAPILDGMDTNLNVKEIKLHFHKPPAKSFLRTWRKKGIKDGGDDLSSFRNTVLFVNKTKKTVMGIEPGRGGIPLRGITPIIFDGKHYGSVEMFFNFVHLKKVMKFAENKNSALFINKDILGIAKKFSKNKKIGDFTFVSSVKKIDVNSINIDILKQGYKKLTYKISRDKSVAAFPAVDYSGKVFGVIYYVFDLSKILSKQRSLIFFVFFSYFLVGFIIISILLFVSSKVITRPLIELVHKSQKLSKGYLTETSTVYFEDEIGKISEAYNDVVENLRAIVSGINNSTNEVSNATDELASSSDDLAARTNEQAASITETSTTLEEFTSIVNHNSSNSDEASGLLENLNSQVQQNVELIDEVNSTMTEINNSSKEINNIVSVINDISFQTNLLALNAAVEAARAGEHGRGFAVVASEVRNLAGKTAESSKSIQDIIQKNMESTTKGTELVSETAKLFSSIVVVMSDVVNKIKQINEGSKEQSIGINQINEAIGQLETVINQNAALVEELSTTGKHMKGNVQELFQQISKLKMEG